MVPALWLIIQIGSRRIPIPLVLLLPLALALDIVALIALSVYGIWHKKAMFLRIGPSFYLSRLTIGLMLYGGNFRINVRDKDKMVCIFAGLHY